MSFQDEFFRDFRLRRRRKSRRPLLLGLAVLLVVVVMFGGCGALYFGSRASRTLTVTRLDDQARHGGHRYMVFARQGVFEDKDSLWFLKFNSSDVWNQLQEGRTYRCETVGWRIPVFSMYPNLVSCRPAR